MSITYVNHILHKLGFDLYTWYGVSDDHNIPHKYVQVKMMSYFYCNYTDLL